MSKVFFISDMHFNHDNIIRYTKRPFKSVEEMNEAIIENWNNVVGRNDKVFILGDFGMGDEETISKIVFRLKGNKTLILGNHDRTSIEFWNRVGIQEVFKFPIIYKKQWILSHEPLPMSDEMPYCNLHGHIHDKKMDSIKHINVSVEAINYTPILMKDIQKKEEDLTNKKRP